MARRKKHPPKLRSQQIQRQAAIEGALVWMGWFTRAMLVEAFGISPVAASADIKLFLKQHRGTVRYNGTLRIFQSTPQFKPTTPRDLSALLEVLNRTRNGNAGGEFYARVAVPNHNLRPSIVGAVLDAAVMGRQIPILYQSIGGDKSDGYRVICPTAFASDGFRFHVRAWCQQRQAFRDFVLARITDVKASSPAPSLPIDKDWLESDDYRFELTPKTPKHVVAGIVAEFGEHPVKVRTKRAFGRYVATQLGLLKLEQR